MHLPRVLIGPLRCLGFFVRWVWFYDTQLKTTLCLPITVLYVMCSCTPYSRSQRQSLTPYPLFSHARTRLEDVDIKSISFYNLGGLAKCKIFSGQQREKVYFEILFILSKSQSNSLKPFEDVWAFNQSVLKEFIREFDSRALMN